MNWQDRLQPEIYLTSPSGYQFTALWKGGSRSKEKMIGEFNYPMVNGTLVQQLGTRGDRYPITIYFDGDDHDIESSRFYDTCSETGNWLIDHPTLGPMTLALVSVSEEIQPIDSAGITAITTEWILPIDGGLIATVPQLEEGVMEQIENVKTQSVKQFVKEVQPSKIEQLKNAVRKTVTEIKKYLTVDDTYYREINNNLNDVATDLLSLAGQMQYLITDPGISSDLVSRMQSYGDILLRNSESMGGVNQALVQEFVCTMCVVGASDSIINAQMTSREEALSYIDQIKSLADTVNTVTENSQTLFINQSVRSQYIAQSQSYTDLQLLISLTTALLLRRSYDLAVTKRIILTRNRSPIDIAITENIDLDVLIESNGLSGNDILLLPAGRQVVVYL